VQLPFTREVLKGFRAFKREIEGFVNLKEDLGINENSDN